jgi:hypothetical protein
MSSQPRRERKVVVDGIIHAPIVSPPRGEANRWWGRTLVVARDFESPWNVVSLGPVEKDPSELPV